MHSIPSSQAVRGHDDRAPTERPPAPPPFVSAGLLAGMLPAASEARLAELVESQLVRLNACEARLDLDLAAVLATLSMGDVHVLGHGDREAFSSERLGFSWSHARELLDMRKKLEALPLLRSAFLLGVLRRARLREIAKVATPETQAAWLAAARSLTSGELSARVKGARGKDAAKDLTESPAASARVSIRVSPEKAVFIESVGLPMLRCVTGMQGPKHALIKQMTAEILTELGPADAHDHEGSCNPEMPRAMRRKMQADAKKDAKVHRACQAWSARAAGAKPRHDPRRPGHAPWYVAGGEPDIAWPTAASDELGDRLAHAQALVRWRRSIDWQRARLLALFLSRGWYGARRHASFGDWLDRRTGLAPREAAALMRTAEHITDLGEIERSWRSGEMTWYQADRVSRVTSHETAEDWARFVQQATAKRLDLELAVRGCSRSSSRAPATACGERRMARCEAQDATGRHPPPRRVHVLHAALQVHEEPRDPPREVPVAWGRQPAVECHVALPSVPSPRARGPRPHRPRGDQPRPRGPRPSPRGPSGPPRRQVIAGDLPGGPADLAVRSAGGAAAPERGVKDGQGAGVD